MDKQLVDITEELAKTLSSINGSIAVQEEVFFYYTVVVDKEENRDTAREVANLLTEQAEKYNLNVDIAITTKEDIEEIKTKMLEKAKEGE
jgi:hypothetical protein